MRLRPPLSAPTTKVRRWEPDAERCNKKAPASAAGLSIESEVLATLRLQHTTQPPLLAGLLLLGRRLEQERHVGSVAEEPPRVKRCYAHCPQSRDTGCGGPTLARRAAVLAAGGGLSFDPPAGETVNAKVLEVPTRRLA